MRPLVVSTLLGLSLLLLGGASLAGPKEEARAGKLFDQAEEEYQVGHFQKAIDLLLEAQRLAPDPVLDYNLARAYEGIGQLDAALASYRAYVTSAPSSKDRGAVEVRIKTLEELAAKKQEATTPATPVLPAKPAPATEPAATASPVPWVIAGIGALGLGAGGVLGGLSLGRSDEADDPATSGVDSVALHDEAVSFATGANITFGVAGAFLAAGVVWGIVDVATLGGAKGDVALRFELGGSGGRLIGVF